MDKNAIEYLTSLDMGDVLITRVNEVSEFYTLVLGQEFESIFVSEYVDKNSERVYENLWFFYPDLICEAKSFKSKDDFDVVPLNKFVYLRILKTEFDGKEATENSRMSVEFYTLSGRLEGQLKASKQNCNELMKILTGKILKYIK